jgi:hypothetical protein
VYRKFHTKSWFDVQRSLSKKIEFLFKEDRRKISRLRKSDVGFSGFGSNRTNRTQRQRYLDETILLLLTERTTYIEITIVLLNLF